jgi:hypothetical protein
MRDYFRKKVMQLTARKKEVKKQKDLLPKYYVILVFESIFWKQYYRREPTGSVERWI